MINNIGTRNEQRNATMGEQIKIEMRQEEAIVLFEYLARVNEKGILDSTFESQAEQIVLWNLQAIVEKQLTEPFNKDYNKIVANARKALLRNGDKNQEITPPNNLLR